MYNRMIKPARPIEKELGAFLQPSPSPSRLPIREDSWSDNHIAATNAGTRRVMQSISYLLLNSSYLTAMCHLFHR
ncbi:hypothetical protein BYT27DRAFT_6395873 [Phlegmacium glaucopus]|nr:hypothetical protein BYT27DRAFT_6395873 [Phlegmacium glaucopus]